MARCEIPAPLDNLAHLEGVRTMIQGCWAYDPGSRPSITQCRKAVRASTRHTLNKVPRTITSLIYKLAHFIAFYVALPDDPLNARPPRHLIALLLTSRAFYSTLNYRDNPYLYARIFHATFDGAAIYRRFPSFAINPSALARELIRRWTVLSQIRMRASLTGYAWRRRWYQSKTAVEELFTAYALFIESDGGNARILTNYARIEKYLSLYELLIINPQHHSSRIPEESDETSLWLWLSWFTLDYSEFFPSSIVPIPLKFS